MLKIRIVSPGKIREPYLREAVEKAARELSRSFEVEICEVEDSPDNWPVEKALAAEAQRIRAHLKANDYLVALDLEGQWIKPDSQGTLRTKLNTWREQIQGDLVLLIGGSNGLDTNLLAQTRERICLSKMTFTHQMARLLLLELLVKAGLPE